jgi:hypothetical protein
MMVIQLTLVVALQEHSDCVVTATLTLPPLASTADDAVPSETPHFAGVGPNVVEDVEDPVQPFAPTATAIAIAAARRQPRPAITIR